MRKWRYWLIFLLLLAAVIVWLEWLGSERERKLVEVPVELPDETGQRRPQEN